MANELSTAGVLVKVYRRGISRTAPNNRVYNYTQHQIHPDLNPEPSGLEVTDLSDTDWKRYIKGLKDPGSALAFGAHNTSAFQTAWDTLVGAAETAAADSKATWFEIYVPGTCPDSFFFTGTPSALGLSAMEVDAAAEIDAYVTPNSIFRMGNKFNLIGGKYG